MTKADRRLMPIVSLDVAGYTRLIQRDESATFQAIRSVFDELAAPTIAEHGGLVFKRMGDALLAEFPSVVGTVEWVVRIQRRLFEQPVSAGGGESIQLRAGLVMADVMLAGDERYGEGINLAVRIQGLAPAGGMAMSKWMYEYLVGKVDLSLSDIGSQAFKNVAKTIRLFIWHPDPNVQQQIASNHASAAEQAAAPEYRPSVVVLPFDNL